MLFRSSGIRGAKFFKAAIYMPNIISAVALATMWMSRRPGSYALCLSCWRSGAAGAICATQKKFEFFLQKGLAIWKSFCYNNMRRQEAAQ